MGAVRSRGSFGDTVLSKRKTWLRQRQGCLLEEYRREIPIFLFVHFVYLDNLVLLKGDAESLSVWIRS